LNESPIFVKTQTFLVWMIERSERFRKSQRFVMAQRVQSDVLDFMDCLISAAKSRDPLANLQKADVRLEMLRRHIRICVDLKLLTINQYQFAAESIVEIGKLLGGWIASSRADRRPEKQAAGLNAGNS